MSINEVCAEAMKAQGKRQADLCKATGFSRATISNFIRGRRNMSSRQLPAVMDALGLEIRMKSAA